MKSKLKLTTLFLGLTLLWVAGAWAQSSSPTPQFAFLGFIQEATLDTSGAVCTPSAQSDALGNHIDVSRLRGGTMTVNGVKMIVPCNSVIQFPAATFTWADLFNPNVSLPVGSYIGTPPGPLPVPATTFPVPANPVPGGPGKTGLALADSPAPFPSFEVSVNGNIVGKNADGTDRYVVGLIVPVTQQGLNSSSGRVSYIDYTFGSFRVGGNGAAGCSPSLAGGGPTCTGTLVQFNDPVGRWGLTHSIDPRFSGDPENVTIHTSTGFPLCIPRVAPPAYDAACPVSNGPDIIAGLPNTGNRPLNGDARFPVDPFLAPGAPLKIFDMPAPVIKTQAVPVIDPATGQCVIDPATSQCKTKTVPVIDPATGEPTNTVTPDAYKQIPLMVGDQVVYSGTLYKIDPRKTILAADGVTPIPDNTAANSYISSHTVEDVLGIFTAPGVAPAYVYIEAFLIGTNGAGVNGILQEASTRMTVVGFTSDPTRLVDIYAIDVNPCSGQETLRSLASEDPAVDAIRGRFVHRVLGGLFMPPTRMYVIKSRTQTLDPITGLPVPLIAANGIATGQFALPNFEYVFPENHRLGDPFLPNNYQDMPFLALGSGPFDTAAQFGDPIPIPGRKTGLPGSAIIGQLNPWPGDPATKPAPPSCPAGGGTSPTVLISPATISVATGAAVTLTGAVTFDPKDAGASRSSAWAQSGGTAVTGTPGGTVAAPTFTFSAPNTAGVLTFTLTATDNFGIGTGTVNVNVLAASDIVQITAATFAVQRGKVGPFGKLNVTATSSDPTAILTLVETPVESPTIPPSCPLTAPVAGGTCDWGTGSETSPGIYDWVENKGAPQPASITVSSSKGGKATTACSAPNAKGTVSCP